jgi:hypothetical protein
VKGWQVAGATCHLLPFHVKICSPAVMTNWSASHVTQRVSRDLVRLTNALIRERAALEQACKMVTKAGHIRKRRGSYPYTHFLKNIYIIVIRCSLATQRYLTPNNFDHASRWKTQQALLIPEGRKFSVHVQVLKCWYPRFNLILDTSGLQDTGPPLT